MSYQEKSRLHCHIAQLCRDIVYRIEQPRIAAFERQVAQWADETWLVSEYDKLELSQYCAHANLRTIPNGVDLEMFFPKHKKQPDCRLIFVGNLNVFHNVDAVKFLVQDIWPLIREKTLKCKLYIVGAGESRELHNLAQKPDVVLAGFVRNLNEVLNQASVFVAPLRFSAGVQNKVLEAMAAGVPVVTTNNVNSGLGAEIGREILVADEAQGIAEQVIILLKDLQFRRELGLAGRRFVERHYSWQAAVQRMAQIEQGLLQSSPI